MADSSTPSAAGDAGIGLALNYLTSTADDAIKASSGVPFVGQAVSGLQSGYHLFAAGYDAINGERDSAVSHGAQALTNAAMVIPGVNEAVGGVDSALGYGGTALRAGAEMFGVDSALVDAIPTGVADIGAMQAVAATNAIFGAEDMSNNTGTRGGEISAGMMGLDFMMTGGNPIAMAGDAISWAAGTDMGSQIASSFGVANNPTSGVEPSIASTAGQMAHEYLGDLF